MGKINILGVVRDKVSYTAEKFLLQKMFGLGRGGDPRMTDEWALKHGGPMQAFLRGEELKELREMGYEPRDIERLAREVTGPELNEETGVVREGQRGELEKEDPGERSTDGE